MIIQFSKKIYLLLVSLMLSISFGANAGLITIDFEDFAFGNFSSGTEDGVLISAVGTTPQVATSGVSGKAAYSNICCGTSGVSFSLWTFSLENTDLLFTFEKLDIAGSWHFGDGIRIDGYFNGDQIGSDTFKTEGLNYKTETADGLQGVKVDQLKITMRNQVGFPFMDNIILKTHTQVPEPTTIAIFALSLMGLASHKFKKKP
jgi:hypothetical protein